jgi:hypothetical protein
VAGLDELRRLAPPPGEPTGRVPDLETVRAQLGVELPEDYRALAREWGAGEFDEFITVYEPGHHNPNLELVRQARGWEWALHYLRDRGEELPFPPGIAQGGLLAWGASGNGDPCFWHLRSEDPDSWAVVVQEARGPEWHVHEGGLADFVTRVLDGSEAVSFFPEDVPSDSPGFARAD